MLSSNLRIGFIVEFSIENKFFKAFSSYLHDIESMPDIVIASNLTFNMFEIFK